MRIIIHDLSPEEWNTLPVTSISDDLIVSDQGDFNTCIGCFGCWLKTPGLCIIKDGYHGLPAFLGLADELIILSRNFYGSYSPFVKTVIDRCIGYMLPYFRKTQGEMHHKPRYLEQLKLQVIFYGENQSDEEMATARDFVKRESINLNAKKATVYFVTTLAEVIL